VCSTLENAINKALKWATNTNELLAPLAAKTCIIYIQEFERSLIFKFGQTTITVLPDTDAKYSEMPEQLDDNECWVSVSLFALDKLKQNNQLTKLIKAGQLDFAGDLGILQGVSRLFDSIDIDVEEILSGYIGDAPAYQLNTSLQKLTEHAKEQFKLFSSDLSNRALGDNAIGVRKIMVVNYCDEVSILRTDVERLEAKLTILEEQVKSEKGQI
jgi:ubiquinone biosynthesis protein UbiJ